MSFQGMMDAKAACRIKSMRLPLTGVDTKSKNKRKKKAKYLHFFRVANFV